MQNNEFRHHICKKCWTKKVKKVKEEVKKVKKPKKDDILNSDEISLNGLNGDLKAIKLYKELSQKIHILMRKNRIEKYGLNAQNIIIDLMNACYKHLQKELKEKVISVEWDEIPKQGG